MLLANETVARFIGQKKSPGVYRIHGKPDEQKLERLGLVARKLGVEVDLESLSDPLGVSRWLAKIQKHPRRVVLEMLLLRSLKQAVYDTGNVGHFGLASEAYVHFTSPIRRYPDVEVHRVVKHLLRGGKPDTSPAALETLGSAATRASTRERAAMEVEREVVDLYRTLLMRDRLGETLEGTVTALVGSGVYVALDAPYVDVLVRFEVLGPDRYEMGEDQISMVGARSGDTISLGDRMLVTIDDVAVLRRTVYARRVVPESVQKQFDDGRLGEDSRDGRGGGRPGRGGRPGARDGRPGGGGRPGGRDGRPAGGDGRPSGGGRPGGRDGRPSRDARPGGRATGREARPASPARTGDRRAPVATGERQGARPIAKNSHFQPPGGGSRGGRKGRKGRR